jgi:hypothetical protein
MYKYKIWAWAYIDGEYREWKRTITRKRMLSEKQKENLSGNFADKMCNKHYCNIGLYGCTEIV